MKTVEPAFEDAWQTFLAELIDRSGNGIERKQERSRRRDKEIQSAALRVFARDGIAKARISDIAAEAAVPTSTIYEYYENKEELAYSVPMDFLAKFFSEYAEKVADKTSSYDKLAFYLWLSADFARRNPVWARLLYLEIWPSVIIKNNMLRHTLDDYVRVILYLLKEGEINGEWPRDPNPHETAAILTGAINQIIITKALYGKPRNLSKAAEHAIARLMPLVQGR